MLGESGSIVSLLDMFLWAEKAEAFLPIKAPPADDPLYSSEHFRELFSELSGLLVTCKAICRW